jgi:hypothetical protein
MVDQKTGADADKAEALVAQVAALLAGQWGRSRENPRV